MMSQLHLSVGEGIVYAIANGGFLPNASLFSGSFLLGPGFAVGGNTLVSPGAVVLGPLPLFAVLAALPNLGTPGALVSSLVWLPPLIAALATMWWQRRHPDPDLAGGRAARLRRRDRGRSRLGNASAATSCPAASATTWLLADEPRLRNPDR